MAKHSISLPVHLSRELAAIGEHGGKGSISGYVASVLAQRQRDVTCALAQLYSRGWTPANIRGSCELLGATVQALPVLSSPVVQRELSDLLEDEQLGQLVCVPGLLDGLVVLARDWHAGNHELRRRLKKPR